MPTDIQFKDELRKEEIKLEEQIEMLYDDVYKVTKVDMKDFGSPSMQHWQVGGS